MFTVSTSPRTDEKSPWYRGYVLFVLLLISIHSLCTRNLPSYLVTVQVPGCELLCDGVAALPLCGTKKWDNFTRQPTHAEACQICRAMGGTWPRRGKAKNALFSVDGAARVEDGAPFAHSMDLTDENELFATELVALAAASKDGNYYNMADGACMHQWEYGLLIGYGFAIVFGIGSIPAGWVCDRRPRVAVASISLLAWSVATSMQATSHDFWSLVACRAIVGLAQAFAMPAAMSIASDVFPSMRERRNIAMAVLSVGFYLGSGCASFSIWFAALLGWRWAMLLAGISGIVLAVLLHVTVQEPERTEFSAPCDIAGVRDEIFIKSRVARWCLLAGSAKMLSAYVLGSFLPIWYSRKNLPGYSNVAYAGLNALIIAGGGLLSTIVGSVLDSYWVKHDSRAPCWIGLIGATLSIPLVFLVMFVPHFIPSMLWLFFLIFVSESWFAPIIALVQRSVRQSHRGQAVPMFLVAITLCANMGPAMVGFLDPGDAGVGKHILWVAVVANVIAAAGFLFTAREITLDPVAAAIGDQDEDFRKPVSGVSHWLAPF